MNKTLKIFAIIMITIVMVCMSTEVFATTTTGVIESIKPSTTGVDATGLTGLASKVIGLIQIASAVAAVVLVAVFGFKFIMGSANEKADYQKSFIPLIVGVVVVFSATSIAKLLFSLLG